MEFRTKKELLEYLGKKGNDNKLVDRMILRDEVYRKDWMYVLVNKTVIIKELENKLKDYDELVDRVNKLSSENSRLIREKNELIQKIIDSWDTSSDDDIINKVYKYLTQIHHMSIDKTEFKEWIEKLK